MKWALVGLLTVHGLIHLLGFVKTWDIADVKALSDHTTIPLAGAPLHAFGLVWLAVCVAFVLAAALLALGSGAWLPLALGAAAASQVVIILWWRDAHAGTIANLVVFSIAAWLFYRERASLSAEGRRTHAS